MLFFLTKNSFFLALCFEIFVIYEQVIYWEGNSQNSRLGFSICLLYFAATRTSCEPPVCPPRLVPRSRLLLPPPPPCRLASLPPRPLAKRPRLPTDRRPIAPLPPYAPQADQPTASPVRPVGSRVRRQRMAGRPARHAGQLGCPRDGDLRRGPSMRKKSCFTFRPTAKSFR
jgi:hypothetical protein